MKNPWLNRTVLRAPHFKLCTTEKMYLKECANLGVKDPLGWIGSSAAAGTHTLHNSKGQVTCIVCISSVNNYSPELIAALLSHEAVHVAQNMFEYIGENAPGREIEAYAVQNIVYELLSEYKRQSKSMK